MFVTARSETPSTHAASRGRRVVRVREVTRIPMFACRVMSSIVEHAALIRQVLHGGPAAEPRPGARQLTARRQRRRRIVRDRDDDRPPMPSSITADYLQPDEARVRRFVAAVGHDPAPLGQDDIALLLRDVNAHVPTAAAAAIVMHGLRRCEVQSGDSVRCVACGLPIVTEEWAVVERASAAFHAACLSRLRGRMPLPVCRIRRP